MFFQFPLKVNPYVSCLCFPTRLFIYHMNLFAKKNLFMQEVETKDLKVGKGRIKSNFL